MRFESFMGFKIEIKVLHRDKGTKGKALRKLFYD